MAQRRPASLASIPRFSYGFWHGEGLVFWNNRRPTAVQTSVSVTILSQRRTNGPIRQSSQARHLIQPIRKLYRLPCTVYHAPCIVYLTPCTLHREPCTVLKQPPELSRPKTTDRRPKTDDRRSKHPRPPYLWPSAGVVGIGRSPLNLFTT